MYIAYYFYTFFHHEMKEFNWTEEFSNKNKIWNIRLMYDVLEKVDNPHLKIENRVIHVAGTNGKGSTVNFIRTILEKAGFKVGMYTSPHLVEYNERIYANGRYITDKEINKYKQEIIDKYKNFAEISYFEITTVIAIMFFANLEPKLDYYIFEVGLGGRLDATNIFKKPLASIITSISFDHMDKLGDSLEEIAHEKGGIIKPNVPVFTSNTNDKIVAVLQKIVNEKKTKMYRQNKDYKIDYSLEPSLLGEHQYQNASLAKEVCKFLKVNDNFIRDGVSTTVWSGRLEVIYDKNRDSEDGYKNKTSNSKSVKDTNRTAFDKNELFSQEKATQKHKNNTNLFKIYLDGAHNEDGIRVLCEFVKQTRTDFENKKAINNNSSSSKETYRKNNEKGAKGRSNEIQNDRIRGDECNIIGVFACLKRKDYKNFFPILKKANFDKMLFFDVPKEVNDFVKPEELQELATKNNIDGDKISNFHNLDSYCDENKQNILFIFGSLYFIGWIKEQMCEK